MCHFVCYNQIWCHKPAVFFCFICHTDVDFFSHLFIIQWTICIRLYKSCLLCLIWIFQEKLLKIRVIFILITDSIPHLQECHRQWTYCITFQTNASIFPLSIRMCQIKIFICKIIASCESNLRNFSMISVVQK